jgi:transcription elongation GreA/GreB family factor
MFPNAVPPRVHCTERQRLGQAVVSAAAAMHAAQRAYDAAKGEQVRDHARIARLRDELTAAESAAREAQRQFDEHVREHRCKA